MKETARSHAVDILNRMEDAGQFAEPLLDACLSRNSLIDIHDRRLLTEIVYGTLRMRGRIDWLMERFYRGDPAKMERGVRNILRTALYQLLFTDRIPAFAVVDEAVKLAKSLHPAASGLVNAVLRNVIRQGDEIPWPDFKKDPAGHIAVYHSHPLWLVRQWIALFGAKETLSICEANNSIPPLVVRVNCLKAARGVVMDDLRRNGFDVKETVFSPDGLIISHPAAPVRDLAAFQNGIIQVQDEASQLIARLVDPQPGENVLDACAGAGVKTSHLAELMRHQGRIRAFDSSAPKLKALHQNMKRLGVTIVEPLVRDAARDPGDAFRGAFDRMLLDVPCSGLGTLRRNPEIKWRITPGDIRMHATLQRKLLDGAAAYLKRGGRLVYCTCSIMPGENEAVIRAFLARHKEFQSVPPAVTLPPSMVTAEGFFKTRPDRHGTDGFFAAILQRL